MRKSTPLIAFVFCFVTQNLLAQESLINRAKNAITGKALSMTDSARISLSNQIKTLKSFTGKRINTITIEQHNFSTSIDAKESTIKDI
ncbi:MAG: hypothetical protein RLZZ391_1171, partial [Bacteroidota bacterium]